MDLWIICPKGPPISAGDWVCCAGNIYIHWDNLCVLSSPPPVGLGQRAVGILLCWIERQTKLPPWAEKAGRNSGGEQKGPTRCRVRRRSSHLCLERHILAGCELSKQDHSWISKLETLRHPQFPHHIHIKGETKESIDFYSGNDCQNIPCTQVQLAKSGDKQRGQGVERFPLKPWNGLSSCQWGSRQPYCWPRASHPHSNRANVLIPALVEASAAWRPTGEGIPLLQEHPPLSMSLDRETQTTYNDLKGPAAAWYDECIWSSCVCVGRDRERLPPLSDRLDIEESRRLSSITAI